jgi:hypothetical protein
MGTKNTVSALKKTTATTYQLSSRFTGTKDDKFPGLCDIVRGSPSRSLKHLLDNLSVYWFVRILFRENTPSALNQVQHGHLVAISSLRARKVVHRGKRANSHSNRGSNRHRCRPLCCIDDHVATIRQFGQSIRAFKNRNEVRKNTLFYSSHF